MKALHEEAKTGFYVVGIGASAGGLAALKQFLAAMPEKSGIAFVIVVHLSPVHESFLSDLLQPSSKMPIMQVSADMVIEPDHVYVIPPGRNLSTIDTHLRLSPLESNRRLRAPIDHFLATLAETHGRFALGVILTGTGSDGAAGLKKIKSAGGLALVQEPGEAEFDGMPRSAIAGGFVDCILPVAEIAKQIVRFTSIEPQVAVPEDEESVYEELSVLEQIFALVRSHTGKDFARYKTSTVLRRIRRRMQIRQVEDMQDYLRLLRETNGESKALADDLLITVTSFFRDAEVFEMIGRTVLPQIFAQRGPQDRVRVWCAGCSTGEEAYSLAILLLEFAGKIPAPPEIQIFASDLHQESLDRAREGFYAEAIEPDVTQERLNRFFTRVKGGFQVRKEVRSIVVFATHNLLRDPPFSQVDLISCRNLLIYLKRDAQDEVIKLFHYALNPGKFLLLGSSETAERTESFRVENKKHCLYARRAAPQLEGRVGMFLSSPHTLPPHTPLLRAQNPLASVGALHQKMVERYAPPSILIGPDLSIVHISENAAEYLTQPAGEPTNSILKRVRSELLFELTVLVQLAKQHATVVRSRPVSLGVNGEMRQVKLTVRMARETELEGYLLLLFDDEPVDRPAEDAMAGAEPPASSETRLAAELELNKARLQKLIEEFEAGQEEMWASNEEMQSANEELRSTLEELETSKEELQSMNEELQTVNQENRHKVEELSQLSGDLQNLLTATDIATLFLDQNLRIMRFTPRVGQLFNIRPVDRGRPLSDLTHRLGYENLYKDAGTVLKTLAPVEREVRTEDGLWFLIRMLPYRAAEDRVDGVVLTCVDITRVRSAERATQEGEERYRLLIESAREYAIFMTDEHGIITAWNRGAERIFGYTEAECLGHSVSMLFPKEEGRVEEAGQMMVKTTDAGEAADEGWRLHKSGSRFWATSVTTALRHPNGDLRGFAHILRDNTDKKNAEAEMQARNEELTRINAELEEFAYVASHDLREPMRMVNIYSQLLLNKIDVKQTPEVTQFAESIRNAIHRMEALVEDLLDYSRAAHSEFEEGVEVDCRRALEETLKVCQTRIAETGALIKIGELPVVRAQEDHVSLVFQNLLSNSLKYTKAGHPPAIEVCAKREADEWILTVKDDGIGFSPRYAERIFGLSKRLHKNAYPGTGLGLAICRRVLQRHDGKIWAESPGEGQGATFSFSLPAVKEKK
jgi:two-component system CheB/CheR fusion protein